MSQLTWLSEQDSPDAFPDVEKALVEPPGLLAAGGDLKPERLLAAYRRGIFPWYSRGQPILWWSPDPRAVLFPLEFKTSRSLAKAARNRDFELRVDTEFSVVMAACGDARARPEGTWITREMRAAYLQLHLMGVAHSIEIWRDNQLAGGLYGVQLGQVFFGESMFSRVNDASKIALKVLCEQPLETPIAVIDCQMATPHLRSLGVREISRADYITLLRQHIS